MLGCVNPLLPKRFCDVSAQGGGFGSPRLTFERVRISGCVIYHWKARDYPTSKMYKVFLNLAPFFKMAAKWRISCNKNVYSYNSGYKPIESIFQMLMAKVMF